MSKIQFAITAIACLFINSVLAQNTAPNWASFNLAKGDNSDRYNQIIADGSGNFLGVGYTFRSGNYRDFLVVKLNANGDTIWTRTKNGKGSAMDEAVAATVDPNGNIFVTGVTDDGNLGNDILLIKYDAAGNKLFDTTWNSPSALDDYPVAIASDLNGNIFIGGNVQPDTVSGNSDYITLKFDNNGGLIWASQFSRAGVVSGKDEMASMKVDSLGDVYVTGRSFNGTDDDFATLKYLGSSGAQSWLQIYNSGNGNDRGAGLVLDYCGNVIITGKSRNGTGNDDFRTLKYTNSGVLQWSKFYNAPANQDDKALAIATDNLCNIYVTGESDIDNSANINYDFATIKYNSSGTQQWAKINGSVYLQYDIPSSIVVDGSGNVFVTGKSDQNPGLADDNDWMTLMYSSTGAIQWTNFKSGTNTGKGDTPANLILDGSNHVYVAGSLENNISQKDATVIKYDNLGTELIVASYNGIGDFNDNAKNIVIDVNNYAYTAGYAVREDNNRDASIIQTDPGGIFACQYFYSGIKLDDDEFNDLAISINGNIYAVGYSKVSGQKSDFLVVKFSPSICDTVWTRTYDFFKQSDKVESVTLDAVGNIYLAGRSDGDPIDTIDNNDIVTMKIDANGNTLWTQRYNGTGNLRDEPSKILLDSNGDVIVCGLTENVHDDDFIALKYSGSTGAPIWASPAIYGGPFANDDRAVDMTIDSNNNIFLCGYSQTASGNSTEDPVVIKFDPSGVFAGFYSYSGIGADEALAIGRNLSNDIFVAFRMDMDPDPILTNYDFLTMKFDNNLNPVWATPPTYDSPIHKDDIPSDLIVTPAGDVYVTGVSKNDTSAGRTNQNWLTLFYDGQGSRLMISNYDGPNATDDAPNALAIRGLYLWVCGYVEGINNSQKDNAVLQYNLNVSVDQISSLKNSVAFPNPFSSQTKIKLSEGNLNTFKTIEISDITGSLVRKINFSGNDVNVDRDKLTSGMYFYSVKESAIEISHGKLIIN